MRRLAAAACGMALLVSACSSSNDSSKTTSGGSTVASIGSAASGGTAAAPADTASASSGSAAASVDTASATVAPGSPGQQLGINPCGIVTAADVAAVFGGTVADGVVNADNGGCDYDISGTTNTGPVGIAGLISISYGQSDYQTYDEVKAVFPDVVKIDGLGDEAWYYDAASQLHISTGGSQLLISGLLPGDAAAVQAEVVAFGRVVLAKLG